MKMLICVSSLPYAEATLLFGGLIAEIENADVTLMTVAHNVAERPLADEMLFQAQSLLTIPNVKIEVCLGSAAAGILNQAEQGNYDLIVIGAHILSGFFDRFVTSIMKEVAMKATTNVLVVKEKRSNLNRILICTAAHEPDHALVYEGARLAKRTGAEVVILFVTEPLPRMYTGLETMEETLVELLQTNTTQARELKWSAQYFVDAGVKAKIKLRRGIVTDEIHHEINAGDYDLVVIGAQAKNYFWNELLVGNITGDIVELSKSSVLVVRTT